MNLLQQKKESAIEIEIKKKQIELRMNKRTYMREENRQPSYSLYE